MSQCIFVLAKCMGGNDLVDNFNLDYHFPAIVPISQGEVSLPSVNYGWFKCCKALLLFWGEAITTKPFHEILLPLSTLKIQVQSDEV